MLALVPSISRLVQIQVIRLCVSLMNQNLQKQPLHEHDIFYSRIGWHTLHGNYEQLKIDKSYLVMKILRIWSSEVSGRDGYVQSRNVKDADRCLLLTGRKAISC